MDYSLFYGFQKVNIYVPFVNIKQAVVKGFFISFQKSALCLALLANIKQTKLQGHFYGFTRVNFPFWIVLFFSRILGNSRGAVKGLRVNCERVTLTLAESFCETGRFLSFLFAFRFIREPRRGLLTHSRTIKPEIRGRSLRCGRNPSGGRVQSRLQSQSFSVIL